MAFQDAYLTLERASDSQALTILGNAEFARDAVGNLTVSWSDPLKSRVAPQRLTRADILPWLSEGVEQQRNRANAFLVITDAGGSLLRVTWREIDPWSGVLAPEQELWGVATLTSATATVDQDGLALIVYRTDYRFARGNGLLEVRP